ncbi:calcium-binding protein 8 isoform X4 [Callithrix jacchus]|uniref:calcium-binding protein 8 isoform X3 n=1 Tax=Callithrix jacchus TaxID=9483 RepID=UPI00159D983F|nr:calcium-binding protein 8 isoform X3 [Callithrix jacchus]
MRKRGTEESSEGERSRRGARPPTSPPGKSSSPKPQHLDCLAALREKMPFHHVTAGLLYKGNYLNRSLSAGSDSEQLANISVEELDGDGQVDFDEFMTILGPKLVSSEGRDGFLGNTIDSIFWQFDMQRITLEELKHILYHAFRDHLTMKDIENIIINEEESLNETSGNCQTEFEGVHSQKQNRQTCVRKSLICAFAMAFIISVMLIAANQILRSGME